MDWSKVHTGMVYGPVLSLGRSDPWTGRRSIQEGPIDLCKVHT